MGVLADGPLLQILLRFIGIFSRPVRSEVKVITIATRLAIQQLGREHMFVLWALGSVDGIRRRHMVSAAWAEQFDPIAGK